MSYQSRELEVKILAIDPSDLRNRLGALGAKHVGDRLQRIYTYDLFPIDASYHSILWTLNRPAPKTVTDLSLKKLVSLFSDLEDLLSEEDRTTVGALMGPAGLRTLSLSIADLDDSMLELLNHPDFIKVIDRYQTNPNKWLRLREDKGQITLAVKHIFQSDTFGRSEGTFAF